MYSSLLNLDDLVLLMNIKKGQIQMTETIAVLFIFFVLLIFGLIFYYKYVGFSLKEEQQAGVERRAAEVVTKTIFLPEIQCTVGNLQQNAYCLDVMKMDVLSDVMTKHLEDYYFNIFSFANITVREIYPSSNDGIEKVWKIYGNPKKDFTYKKQSSFYVVLRDDTIRGPLGGVKHSFGQVIVEVYS